MTPRSPFHVAQMFGRLCTRSFTTTQPSVPQSKTLSAGEVIAASLRYMDVRLSKFLTRDNDLLLPKQADPDRLVRCRFARDSYFTTVTDRRVGGDDAIVSRAIQRLDFYNRKRELEPFWVDIVSTEPQPVFIRETGKRRLRRALGRALRDRDIHPLGWDLGAYTAYWDAQEPAEREDHDLHANRDWAWEMPATVRGTLVVRVVGPLKLALASSKDLRAMAEAIVDATLAQHRGGPRRRPRPAREGPEPWLARITKDSPPTSHGAKPNRGGSSNKNNKNNKNKGR